MHLSALLFCIPAVCLEKALLFIELIASLSHSQPASAPTHVLVTLLLPMTLRPVARVTKRTSSVALRTLILNATFYNYSSRISWELGIKVQ